MRSTVYMDEKVKMKKFGLLGERLEHSFSPLIHAMLAGYDYKLYEVPPGEVERFIAQGEYDGLNVTIPYKKTVLAFCGTLSDAARKTGSVNTIIKRSDKTLHGDNTDYFGFSYLLRRGGVSAAGKKALVLGNGGAAASVKSVLLDSGAGEIITVSRSGPDNYNNIKKHSDANIIINTTPVGMYPGNGESPVSLKHFDSCEAVLDIIYNPAKTELMLQAEDMGIKCIGGLYMLTAQAKKSCELFTGAVIPDSVIERITETVEYKMKNVALIGMPGCGKSTVGKRLAQLMGREYIDADDLVTAKAGKSIDRIFAEDGENVFRDIEESVYREVFKNSGRVIATGGGIVKREVNRRFLRQNSVTVYLDRALTELPAEGRPLSLSQGIAQLYSERAPLYLGWSDHKITARDGVEQTAQAVYEELGIR